ncbi:hypothetical protein Goari_004843, partial [Gossypium aridum]|nr:hypothetical protein [Gossypium aridum]
VEAIYSGNARVGQCVFAYKCDNNKKKDALKKELMKSQDENVGLRSKVEELEKSLHQHCSRNSVTELKSSLTKIELKRKIEELELGVALQNCELRVELLEMNNEHWKEKLQCSQGQIRDRDHIMSEALTQVPEVANHLQTLAVQANILSLRYKLESDRG